MEEADMVRQLNDRSDPSFSDIKPAAASASADSLKPYHCTCQSLTMVQWYFLYRKLISSPLVRWMCVYITELRLWWKCPRKL